MQSVVNKDSMMLCNCVYDSVNYETTLPSKNAGKLVGAS